MLSSDVFTRYFTATSASEYLVAIPNTPVSHIHSTAPGPPKATAVATPTMLPVPMVAARAVESAPNWLTSPSPFRSFTKDSRTPFHIYRCGKRSRKVKNKTVRATLSCS